jgi:aerobic carbon-monoxide dehydrogenase medium subunit
MYPAPIAHYHRPASVKDALAAAAGIGEGAAFIAGGQSIMQAIKSRLLKPTGLIDLQDVAELRGVRTDGGVKIGAMTRYVDLAGEKKLAPAYAAINDAAAHVGDRQVRNRGTIGGSVCWNYIAACMPAVTLGLGTKMNLVGPGGKQRSLGADEFIGAPLETARTDEELLVSLELSTPPKHAGSAYKKWALMTDGLPVIGVCVYVETNDAGACTKARVAVGGLSTGPKRSPGAEAKLVGRMASDTKGLAEAMAAAASELQTQGDLWADPAYRQNLIRTLGSDVAATAFRRATA